MDPIHIGLGIAGLIFTAGGILWKTSRVSKFDNYEANKNKLVAEKVFPTDEACHERLKGIEKRFDRIDSSLEYLNNGRIGGLYKMMDKLETAINKSIEKS